MPDGQNLSPTHAVAPKPANVRIAGPADAAGLYDLLLALNRAGSFGIELNHTKIMNVARAAANHERCILAGVIDGDDGVLAASVGIFPEQWWYSDEWHLVERWLFVRTEYRDRGYDRDLFAFMENYRATMAAQTGLPTLLVTGFSSRNRIPARTRLWSRYAKQTGAMFVMGAHP